MAELKPQLIIRTTLSPDSIRDRLFTDHARAHDYHLQTTSFSQHKMLKNLYKSLEDSKDSICEYLLGVQAPKRFGQLNMGPTPLFSDMTLNKMIDEGIKFSMELCQYAKSKGQEQLCNMAADLEGVWMSAKYLNTLK